MSITKQAKLFSAGVVPVRQTEEGPRYLLLRCYSYWDFPKGAIEPEETKIDAAIRECKEESSIEDLAFQWGEHYCETPIYGKGKVSYYFVAATAQSEVTMTVNPLLGRPEHDEYRWVSYTEAKTLLSERLLKVLKWAHNCVTSSEVL